MTAVLSLVWLAVMMVGMEIPAIKSALRLEREGNPQLALEVMERAVESDPSNAELRGYRSTLYLLLGDLKRGFEEYEWRWKCDQYKDMPQRPRWDGSPIPEQTLLLHCEQGFGDSFQFVRYAEFAKQRCARVILRCPKPLAPLMRLCPLLDGVSEIGTAMPARGAETTLMSLPWIFGTTLDTIPAKVPYLQADSRLVDHWKNELRKNRGMLVGVNWRGRVGDDDMARRDIPFVHIKELEQTSGICVVSLQKKSGEQTFDSSNGAFMDTAAAMMNLDLIITSDTSIAHLAGALGRPTWVCLPFSSEWRWLLDREDSPWYPSMRLFRQKTPGDWGEVFTRIASELRRLI